MSENRGGRVHKRRVRVSGASIVEVIASLAEAQGLEVVGRRSQADLVVLETDRVDEVERLSEAHPGAPVLVIGSARLRPDEAAALKSAGATRVLDRDACLLQLATSLSELLFDTSCEQKRYARDFGGLSVSFSTSGQGHSGSALVLMRGGAFIESSAPVVEGAPIVLTLQVGDRPAPVHGRVACTRGDGFGVEFALDKASCAPLLQALRPVETRPITRRRVIRAL